MDQQERDRQRLARLREAREDGAFWTANDEREYRELCARLAVGARGAAPRGAEQV